MKRGRTEGWVAILAALALGIGCSGDYVVLHRVELVEIGPQQRKPEVQEKDYIAYPVKPEDSARQVENPTQLSTMKDVRTPNVFHVSPDGQFLVFAAFERDKKTNLFFANLWRIPADGRGGATKLTAGRYVDIDPTFDASGTHIYFASNRTSDLFSICRIRADGTGGITRVTDAGSMNRYPSASPTTQDIFHSSQPPTADRYQIWRVNESGDLPTQLQEGSQPSVSPNGKKVLFCWEDPNTENISVWIMGANGAHPTQLTKAEESSQITPSWSADGKWIFYASDEGKDSRWEKNFDIWMMDADGGNATQLTNNGSTDLAPVCGPQGKFVYFLSNRGLHWEIWRLPLKKT
jgi:Tol biopolymer transport system component